MPHLMPAVCDGHVKQHLDEPSKNLAALPCLEIIYPCNQVWNFITLWCLCNTRLVRIVRLHSHTVSSVHELDVIHERRKKMNRLFGGIVLIWVFSKIGGKPLKWMVKIMEKNPMNKFSWFGGYFNPLYLETSIWGKELGTQWWGLNHSRGVLGSSKWRQFWGPGSLEVTEMGTPTKTWTVDFAGSWHMSLWPMTTQQIVWQNKDKTVTVGATFHY